MPSRHPTLTPITVPIGEVTFEASGYEQRSTGVALVSAEQCLRPDQRGAR